MQDQTNIKTFISDEFSPNDHRPRGFIATNLISLNDQIFQDKGKPSPSDRLKRTVYSRNRFSSNGAFMTQQSLVATAQNQKSSQKLNSESSQTKLISTQQ